MRKFLLIIAALLFVFRPMPAFCEDIFPFLAEITKDNANLRAGPNINFESLIKLKQGEKLIVIDKSYGWYKIQLPAQTTLFIFSEYIKPFASKDQGLIVRDRVNVRAKPNTNSTVITQVNKDAVIDLLEKREKWYRIKPPANSYGWIEKDLVRYISADTRQLQTELQATKEAGPIAAQLNEEFLIVGTVKPFFKLFGKATSYKLIVGNELAYILEAEPALLERYSFSQVKILGEVQNNPTNSTPVLKILKIELSQ